MSPQRIALLVLFLALVLCVPHLTNDTHGQEPAQSAAATPKGVGYLRVPHIDDPEIEVPVDRKSKSTILIPARVFAPVDPAIEIVYYLPQFVQLPAGQRQYGKDIEREEGYVWYSVFVGIPEGFADARKKHFEKAGNDYYSKQLKNLGFRNKPRSAANVDVADIRLVSITPNYAQLGTGVRAAQREFVVEVRVPERLVNSFEQSLESGYVSLNYDVVLYVSQAKKSYMVGYSCKDVAASLGLSGALKFLTLGSVQFGLNSAKQVSYAEYRNVPADEAKRIFENVIKECEFEAEPAAGTASGESGQGETQKPDKAAEAGWNVKLGGNYQRNAERRVQMEVFLEDSPYDSPLAVKLQGRPVRSGGGPQAVRGDREAWHLLADLEKGRQYRISAGGEWEIGVLANREVDACGLQGALPPRLSPQQFKFPDRRPFSLVLKFVGQDGRETFLGNFCDSSTVDFKAPTKGRLEGMMNGVAGAYDTNEEEVIVTVRVQTPGGNFQVVFEPPPIVIVHRGGPAGGHVPRKEDGTGRN